MELTRVGLLLAKIEATAGVDPTPVKTANVMAVMRGQVTLSFNSEIIKRDLLNEGFTRVNGDVALPHIGITFAKEIRGNRTDGTTPDISAGASGQAIEDDCLLQACNLNPTYTAESGVGARDGKVTYKPIVPSDEGKTVTFYFYSMGKLYKITRAKGDISSIVLPAGKYGMINYNFLGLWNAPVDSATQTGATWLNTKPPLCGGANTLTLDGWAASITANLELKLGNQLTMCEDLNSSNGIKRFLITDRDSKGSIDPESEKEADHAVWASWKAGSSLQIIATVGTQTGNKFKATLQAMRDKVTYEDRNQKRIQKIDFSCLGDTPSFTPGNEVQLVFQ
jgi:hypothetical protein